MARDETRLSHQLLDIRPVAAYNGWPLRGESRGGHIKGARSVPYEWCDRDDWIEIIGSKAVAKSEPVTVYGYDGWKIDRIVGQLASFDYTDVRPYYLFADEWCENPNLPMERMARFERLVYPDWLQRFINGEPLPGVGSKRVVCQAHFDNHSGYASGHIPGAIAIDTNELESSDTWNRRTPAELCSTLTAAGIASDTTVVVYGHESSPEGTNYTARCAGQMAAFRTALIMLYAGVDDIRVLNGGQAAWVHAGLPLSDQTPTTTPIAATEFGIDVPGNPQYIVDIEQARSILRSPDKNLVSVRSRSESMGMVSGYGDIMRRGDIVGALLAECGSDAYHMENFRNPDDTTCEYHEIVKRLARAKITAEDENAFYCGTGWRASEAWYNAWLIGFSRISVYDGGWFEWSNAPDGDIEKPPFQ